MPWSEGYLTEVEYTYGYYRELCPHLLRLACLSAHVIPPEEAPLRYLELGFGQGVSLNVHAAANAGDFWGTDFSPSQVAHARALAKASGSGVVALDHSFAELAQRPDLPEFDVIGLHGIWTWISEENSRIVVDILRRKLKVGGVCYISYNCLPGWAPAMPLRHLMKLHADVAGADAAGITGRVEGSLHFARQVIDSGALYFRGNPAVGERLKKISDQNRNYLAHEYFHEDWRVMTFSDVASVLDAAKLSFVCSAHLLDHVDGVNLNAEGTKLLAGIHHPILKQSVRDYLVNQQFRRDVFVKGPRRLSPHEQAERMKNESFMLTTPADEVPTTVQGSLGEATLHENIYKPLIRVLAERDYGPKKVGQLIEHSSLRSLQLAQIVQALIVLTGAGHVSPARPSSDVVRSQTQALNRYLMDRACDSADVGFFASPVTGGGVPVSRFHQLFLLAMQLGRNTAAEQVRFAHEILKSRGQRIVKSGKVLETDQENRAELQEQAIQFQKRLPILAAAGLI
jgi:hypothetical protein